MAGKKPAKKNITNTPEKKKELPGKAVMYFGVPGKGFTCPTCNKTLIKGIIYEYNGSSFCTRSCIPKPEVEAVA
jgi:hypothetical protein